MTLVLLASLPTVGVCADDPQERQDAAVADLRMALRADTPSASISLAGDALTVLDAIIADRAAGDWPRARAQRDRLVALNLLGRHAEVAAGAAALRAEGAVLPAYVLGVEADALAALHRPGEAIVRYREALALMPDDAALVLGLAYAQADLDRPDEAWSTLAPLAARAGGEGRGARQLQAMLRAWSGWSDQAARQLADEARLAGDDGALRRQRADLERLRDRPLAALALLEGDVAAGAGISRAQALHHRGDAAGARAQWQELAESAGGWWPLDRALAQHARDRRGFVETRVRAARGDDVQVAAGEVRTESSAWTPLLREHWRGFVAYRRAHADFRGTYLEDQRIAVGARFVGPGWRAQAELNQPFDRFDDSPGLSASAEARLSDDWGVAGEAALRAFDLPLRARGAGTTGDRFAASLRYSPIGQGFVRAGLGSTDYSDGNRRRDWSLGASYRWPLDWWSGLSVSPGFGGSTNSLADVPYFSPRRDLSFDVAVAFDHRIARPGKGRHHQRVEVFAGQYRQAGFLAKGIGGLRYEYRYDWQRRGSLFVRIGRDRRAYDGEPESTTFAEIGASYAFGAR